MGGKDPFIVCADVADGIGIAAKGGAWVAFLNAGQVCTSAERFYVDASVYDDFVSEVVRRMREIKAGTVRFNDPLTDNDAGPFGGFKQSGLGRELGQEGLEAFQETKHVHIETKIAPKSWWYPYGG
jgi:acyl-CoA reductase-like NAD-dependent aldehyde dehydrogenase